MIYRRPRPHGIDWLEVLQVRRWALSPSLRYAFLFVPFKSLIILISAEAFKAWHHCFNSGVVTSHQLVLRVWTWCKVQVRVTVARIIIKSFETTASDDLNLTADHSQGSTQFSPWWGAWKRWFSLHSRWRGRLYFYSRDLLLYFTIFYILCPNRHSDFCINFKYLGARNQKQSHAILHAKREIFSQTISLPCS